MSRRLRVRIIHDTEDLIEALVGTPEQQALGTNDLELLPVPRYDGGVFPYLRSWKDHMYMWDEIAQGREMEVPDLYLIDCDFALDRSATPLPYKPDGRGLLHGVVQVAYAMGKEPRCPFGFAVYSVDPTRMKRDPYAITTFGLLKAMRGELPIKDDKGEDISLGDYFAGSFDELPHGGLPRTVWGLALDMYRTKLFELCRADAIGLGLDSVLTASAAVRAFISGGCAPAEGLPIEWVRVGRAESILLSSLLADCRDGGAWNAEGLGGIIPWLEELEKLGWHQNQYLPAKALLDATDANLAAPSPPRRDMLQRIRGVAVCMYVARMLANKAVGRQGASPNAVTDYFEWEHKQLERAVAEGLKAQMTPEQAIDAVADGTHWPFDPAALLCVTQFLSDSGMPPSDWPKSVK
jgi:hypothetical protein